ncbi:MAG: tagaturonate reductase [Gemmataceae bacterium]|nr:tagaturonate reductase [Gemmataceae bacterium]
MNETVLQFGSGKFLRAFADLFIHHANQQGQGIGQVVIVQSTGGDRAQELARLGGKYHVVVRGLENGKVVDTVESCQSVSRALVANSQWDEVLQVARSPHLKTILSNTTESGYDLNPADTAACAPPKSFPAKLLAVLRERFQAGQPGLMIIPCELRENNARLLREILVKLAGEWKLPRDFITWMEKNCSWHCTLVDRIVTGTPDNHPLLASDPMLTVCEPYALFVIEEVPGVKRWMEHPAITWTSDVLPFFLRKVRILNGGHSALVHKAMAKGHTIVRDSVNDAELGPWVEKLLFSEIVPILQGRCVDPEGFARQVLERFKNPFIDHKLTDILVNHKNKIKVRLIPSLEDYKGKFGQTPAILDAVLREHGN